MNFFIDVFQCRGSFVACKDVKDPFCAFLCVYVAQVVELITFWYVFLFYLDVIFLGAPPLLTLLRTKIDFCSLMCNTSSSARPSFSTRANRPIFGMCDWPGFAAVWHANIMHIRAFNLPSNLNNNTSVKETSQQ